MKKLNAKGPEVLGNLPPVRGLPPKFFQEAIADDDNILIDTRMMLAFGGGHIKGALNIGGSPMLSIWAGWLLDPTEPILLVLDSDEKINRIVRLFRPDQADGGVLRQRLSREHCSEHSETGGVPLRMQRPRKLASMEESRIPG